MRKSLDTITRASLMIAALCTFMTAPAAAIDPAETNQRPLEDSREVLFAIATEPDENTGWLASDNFHIAKKAGIGYTHRLKIGERSLSIGVRGPVMRKQKALGLAFRIRF
jgi:hypothetical protein